jgi:hypothetical protein
MSSRRYAALLLLLLAPFAARADAIPTVSIATGQLGMRKEIPHALAIDVQVAGPWRWTVLRPVGGVLTSSKGGAYVYSGIAAEIPVTGSLQLRPGFAPGIVLANADRELGSRIEFRSSMELSIAPVESMRLGLALSHISNAGFGYRNPGVEILTFNIAFRPRR